MKRIALIEDHEETRLMIEAILPSPHYEMIHLDSIRKASDFFFECRNTPVDLIILDRSLPDGDGVEFLKALQENDQLSEIPVFLLTGNDEINSKTSAFEVGADDYLVKPVHPIELKARVEMRLRKSKTSNATREFIHKGSLKLNLILMKAYLIEGNHERELDLTGKEFKILSYLIQNEGNAFSRASLVKQIWGNTVHVLDRTVDSHVCSLRKKLKEHSRQIESVPGNGYRFIPYSSQIR